MMNTDKFSPCHQPQKNKSNRKTLVFGTFVILFGIGLLLSKLDILDNTTKKILFSWETLLIAIGIINLVERKFFLGLILITIGGFFQISNYYLIPITLTNVFWPIIIIIFGIAIIFKHNKFSNRNFIHKEAENTDFYDEATVFSGSDKYIKNENFRGARITAIFGGSKLNFQQSILSPEGASIDVTLLFGGCELIIPPDWNVRMEVNNIFGGCSDKRNPTAIDPKKIIVLRGICIFGGCEIKSF